MPGPEGLIRIVLVLILMPLTYLTVLRSLWRQMTEAQALSQADQYGDAVPLPQTWPVRFPGSGLH